jgi:HAD superfamily phosphoserine phosphatase-like hydrolase
MTLTKFPTKAAEFIDSVVQLQPRFAAFDCDGTLWAGDAGEGFFSWEFERRLVSDGIIRRERALYAEYRQGRVSEDDMCSEMVTLHEGLTEEEVLRAAAEYFEQHMVRQIFPEMRELVRLLQDAGCDVWAVSSTNEWVIREAMKHFGIAEDRILAAASRVENGHITSQMTRLPTGAGKPRVIREVVKKIPEVAFGNSRWDIDMLEIAQSPFAVNPNPDLHELAEKRGWRVYWPEATGK